MLFMSVPEGDGFVFRRGKARDKGDQPSGQFLRWPGAVTTTDSAAEFGAVCTVFDPDDCKRGAIVVLHVRRAFQSQAHSV